jgi:DNA polymerase IV
MRTAGRVGRTVVLRLRFDNFSRTTRSQTLLYPTANTHTILTTARGLLTIAVPMIERRGITLVGVAVSNLDDGREIQLALPLDRRPTDALDEVRRRFGATAITRAVLLGRGQELTMPLLPD